MALLLPAFSRFPQKHIHVSKLTGWFSLDFFFFYFSSEDMFLLILERVFREWMGEKGGRERETSM